MLDGVLPLGGDTARTDHSEFIAVQRKVKNRLVEQGYRFVGHLRPPRYAGQSYDDQEAGLRQKMGDVQFEFIGDCSEATRAGTEGSALEFTDGWVAVYALDPAAPQQ